MQSSAGVLATDVLGVGGVVKHVAVRVYIVVQLQRQVRHIYIWPTDSGFILTLRCVLGPFFLYYRGGAPLGPIVDRMLCLNSAGVGGRVHHASARLRWQDSSRNLRGGRLHHPSSTLMCSLLGWPPRHLCTHERARGVCLNHQPQLPWPYGTQGGANLSGQPLHSCC